MSFQGFRCPPHVPTAGTDNQIDHCVLTCPHKCVAPGLLMSIFSEAQTNHHVGTYISMSMLTGGGCARQTVLERSRDYYLEPRQAFWPFRGTIAHRCVEDGASTMRQYGWLSEMRMSADFKYKDMPSPILDNEGKFTGEFDFDTPLVITVGGTTDNYNPITLELWDYKSCADYKADAMIKGQKPGTFSPNLDDSWVWQVNGYRYLLSRTRIPRKLKREFNLQGTYFPAPTALGIQAISMMEIPRTGMDYRTRGYKAQTYTLDPVPVFPLEDIEQFIRERALQWYRGLILGVLPPVVPKSQDWLCQSCAFNGHKIAGGPCFPEQERNNIKQGVQE